MKKFLGQGVFLFMVFTMSVCEDEQYSMNCENGVCYREEDKGPCLLNDDKPRLYRWEPIRRGYVRELELEPGKKYKMITLANKPPIFEIPNFLSEAEQEHIKQQAISKGLATSITHFDKKLLDRHKDIQGHSHGAASIFRSWDMNDDGYITKQEVADFGENYKYLYMKLEEVEEMIEKLELKQFADGKVTINEWPKFPTASIVSYMDTLKAEHPVHRERYSNQAWLAQGKRADAVMKRLRTRTKHLLRLPDEIIRGSEPVQVVRYNRNGHYNGHYDSQSITMDTDTKCCHVKGSVPTKCRLCRYATVLYYLNEVPEGGFTAFPAAGNDTYSEQAFVAEKKGDRFNMMENCHDSRVKVKPARGKAIMWYNHFVDEDTGLLGERDDFTIHGGCGVTEGHKWVANNWITASDFANRHLKSSFDDSEDAENVYRKFV